MNFGDDEYSSDSVSLLGFFRLLSQRSEGEGASDETAPVQNEGHTFNILSGMITAPDAVQDSAVNAAWNVRGGLLSFQMTCVIAVGRITFGKDINKTTKYDDHKIYAKPLKTTSSLDSTLELGIYQGNIDVATKLEWGLKSIIKSVPTALWGPCKKFNAY